MMASFVGGFPTPLFLGADAPVDGAVGIPSSSSIPCVNFALHLANSAIIEEDR
jgi:hypothetical protein